jgi:hypothetical protein
MNKGSPVILMLVAGMLFALTAVAFAQTVGAPPSGTGSAPVQPIAFSHKLHAGKIGLTCTTCHLAPKTGQSLTIPQAPLCMQCHQTIAADKPEIQKLTAFNTNSQTIPWIRVYGVPSFVRFSHKTHLEKGNTCKECHGAVETRDQLFPEVDLSMAGCLSCHNTKQASTGCDTCHTLDQTFLPQSSAPNLVRIVSQCPARGGVLHAYLAADLFITLDRQGKQMTFYDTLWKYR